ncbi:hypothetical protein RSSM_01139 [Rhodopirellula sallentina SM41]|uniref:Uncharacterized protein n=1 Tax=Rhodopirellula sallentina SM41 TaxID=1263870 RepID=M5U7H8_9BACT|nr:hypothetical protein RSSM_01139 [Rhodopirellula sallentina SM41]
MRNSFRDHRSSIGRLRSAVPNGWEAPASIFQSRPLSYARVTSQQLGSVSNAHVPLRTHECS